MYGKYTKALPERERLLEADRTKRISMLVIPLRQAVDYNQQGFKTSLKMRAPVHHLHGYSNDQPTRLKPVRHGAKDATHSTSQPALRRRGILHCNRRLTRMHADYRSTVQQFGSNTHARHVPDTCASL